MSYMTKIFNEVKMMEIARDRYLNELINRMNNKMIKVVTGMRRSGKSYLLFNLFYDYLNLNHLFYRPYKAEVFLIYFLQHQ